MSGALAALVVEVALALVLGHARLASTWEVQVGLIGLAPAWLLVATLPGLWGGSLAWLLGRPGARSRIAFGLLWALLALGVGYGVGGGRHLASFELRLGFALALSLVTLGAATGLFPWLVRVGSQRVGGARLAVPLALGLVVVIAVANRVVLVRLYPAFHLGLGFLELGLSGAAFALGPFDELSPRVVRRAGLALALGTVAAAVGFLPGARSVGRLDNFLWVMSEGSPVAALGVELGHRVAPPEAPAAGIASELGARRSKGSGLDLRGRSVLLVTVDALRADHLGLYGGLRGVSPGLDALGRQGVVFDAAYAATPHTSYSLTSVMTGKYMRPLLLQGAGADSDTWAGLLRTYGYRTAAFYPPAVFFIDGDHFTRFRDNHFDFEYAKVEFAEGQKRIQQVKDYLESTRNLERKPLFLWVHLFGPHEPYETQDTDYGPRDIDRYDSEIRAADRTALGVVEAFRARAPDGIVIVSADHGEEFGDHGGRYHGTSVYDEQVRVPLLVVGPGLAQGRRVEAPVQTIDLLPTVLGGLGAPVPPRIRGRDLSDFLAPSAAPDKSDLGRAVAETDDYTLYAEGSSRLVCSRRTGACQLFDISTDPAEKRDVGPERSAAFAELTQKARQLSASHGAYETEGLRAEGKGWPAAILRGLSGDADVAPELGALLDDADVNVRRKAAELLFGLSGGGQQAALRLAATREEDAETRRYIALALTRSGQGAPLVKELLGGPSLEFRRMAALALAESGDDAGREELVGWWRAEPPLEFRQALEVLAALTKIGGKGTSLALASRLGDVRLRPYIARALAQLADDDVRPALARAFASERYVPTRLPLGRALWAVGGKAELVAPLVRFLGTPEPLDGGLGLAVDAGVLDQVGGPSAAALGNLRRLADSGVRVEVTVPGLAREARLPGARLIVLVEHEQGDDAELVVSRGLPQLGKKTTGPRNLPRLDPADSVRWVVRARPGRQELSALLPEAWHVQSGQRLALDVYGGSQLVVRALAVVPASSELPPPPPEAWETPADEGAGGTD